MKLAVKNLLFTVLVPCTVALWLPYAWYWGRSETDLDGWRWFGYLLILLGAAVYISTVWNFAKIGRGTPAPIDPPKKLVVTGLHRYVRNPMYLGVVLALLGELLLFPSRQFLVYIAVFVVAVNVFVLAYEEPTLRQQFGEEYDDYRKTVPRWIPRLRGRQFEEILKQDNLNKKKKLSS